jgi:hypothetical protein
MEFPVPRTRFSSGDKATHAPGGASPRTALRSRTTVVSRFTGFFLDMPMAPILEIGWEKAYLSEEYLITTVNQVTQV